MPVQRLDIVRRVTVACAAAVALFAFVCPAYGVTVTADRSGTNALRIERSQAETSTLVCMIYNRNTAPASTAVADGTWSNPAIWTFEATVTLDPSDMSFEYAPVSTGKYYLVRVNGDSAFLPVYTSPMAVRLWQAPRNGGSVTVVSPSNPAYTEFPTATPVPVALDASVSIGSSVSVAGTLPVTVERLGSVNASGIGVLVAAGSLLLGVGFVKGMRGDTW